MKQYTDKDQTTKLIELGFPEPSPKYIHIGGVSYDSNHNYSVGEMIEFLEHKIYRIENDMQRLVDGARVYGADEELIDALFKACVTLKEERMI